jgi:hypothetical protein
MPKINWLEVFQHVLPVSGVILALVPALTVTITAPLLDYSVAKPWQIGNTSIYESEIVVTNTGLKSANNVMISVSVDKVSVISMDSEPYLPNNTRSFTSDVLNQPGRAIFRIDKLLQQATVTVHMKMDSHEFNNATLTVYVQSDEAVGNHGVVYLVLAYLAVAATLFFISAYAFITERKWRGLWVPGVICLIFTVIMFILILYA